jgi:hypothetical protein
MELPPPQLRDPRHRAVRHDNLLDAIDPSSLSEVDARVTETADRFIGIHAHVAMLRTMSITEQARPSTEYLPECRHGGVHAIHESCARSGDGP